MPSEPWSIGRLLTWTSTYFTDRTVDAPRISAERLLAHVLGCQRIELYTHIAKIPSPEKLAAFRVLVKRRAASEPLEYLTGHATFMTLEFAVDKRVLIPRTETELLVELTLDAVNASRRRATLFDESAESEPVETQTPPPGPIVLDLCTGCGCVALSVAHYIKDATVYACDISPEALAVATENRTQLKLDDRVSFYEGDLFDAFISGGSRPDWCGQVNFLLANPPYIAEKDMPTLDENVRDYEPHLALTAGVDGLDVLRRIVAAAGDWLAADGLLAVETAFDQSDRVAELFEAAGRLTDVRIIRDHQDHGRIVLGHHKEEKATETRRPRRTT